MKKFLSNNSGVSLIIAIIFVSAFMLVMAGLFEARLRVIQAVGNREQEAKARYLAESAAELASYWTGEKVGANSADAANAAAVSDLEDKLVEAAEALGIDSCEQADPANAGVTIKCVGFSVEGRAEGDSKKVQINNVGTQYFSVPIRGTGNVGSCDAALHPDGNAGSACNWNKLYVGESVEIPLFYELNVDEDNDGNPDVSLHNFAESEFKLRVRAPTCSPAGANCTDGRYQLYPLVGSTEYRRVEEVAGVGKDPVLIQWSISDMENAGVSTLVARDDIKQEPLGSGIKKRDIVPLNSINTELSASRINLAKSGPGFNDQLDNFIVLQYVNSGGAPQKHYGTDLDDAPQYLGTYIRDRSKPVLRLNLVGQPQKDDGDPTIAQNVNDNTLDIPYLEYQVLAKDIEISDSKSSIIGWAEIGGFKKEIRRQKQRTGTLGGFALESF